MLELCVGLRFYVKIDLFQCEVSDSGLPVCEYWSMSDLAAVSARINTRNCSCVVCIVTPLYHTAEVNAYPTLLGCTVTPTPHCKAVV